MQLLGRPDNAVFLPRGDAFGGSGGSALMRAMSMHQQEQRAAARHYHPPTHPFEHPFEPQLEMHREYRPNAGARGGIGHAWARRSPGTALARYALQGR